MKKIISLLLVLSVISSFAPYSLAESSEPANENYIASGLLLQSLGVVDEDIDYTHTLTRGEAAEYIVKLIKEEDLAVSYKGIFNDVSESHLRAKYIEHLANKGIVKGAGDFNFYPDNKLTYDNAMVMLVNLLGYGNLENASTSYLTWATQLNLYKNLVKEFDYVNMGDFLVLLINALNAELMIREGYGNNKQYIISDKTLLGAVYNAAYMDGVIVKNDVTYLWSSDNVTEDTVIIESATNGSFEVKVSDSLKTSGDIGKSVRMYYKYEDNEYKYICHSLLNRNNITKIDLRYLDCFYTDLSQKTIAYSLNQNKIEKEKLSDIFYILYNGATYKSSEINFYELKKKSGYIELIDNNSDSKYEILNIKVYDSVVVKEIVHEEGYITDKYDSSLKYAVNDKTYKKITVFDEVGSVSSLEKITIGSIISIAESDTFSKENIIEIRISNKIKSGKITSYDSLDEVAECEIDYIDKHFISDRAFNSNFVIGQSVVAYIDAFDNIVYINVDYGREMQYGIVQKSAYREVGDSSYVIFKILTFDNNSAEYKVSNKVKLDGVWFKDDAKNVYKKLKNVKTKSDTFIISDDLMVIRFKLNENNEISIIDTHNKGADGATDDDLAMMVNETLVVTSGNVLGWSVPVSTNATVLQLTATNYTDINTYTYHFAGGSLSAGSEYSIAAFKSDPESSYADFAMMKRGGIGINNTLYGVKEVVSVYNEELDAPMYKMKGYLKNTYTELWIDTDSSFTEGLTDLEFGDVIRVATDLDNRIFKYDKIVINESDGTNFIKVNGDSFLRNDTTTLTNVYGYIYKRDGSIVITNKFGYGKIPEKPSDVEWETEEKLTLNLLNTTPIILFDSKTKTVEVGTYSDIKDFETYGDEASKILARYRNSTLQEVYIFN